MCILRERPDAEPELFVRRRLGFIRLFVFRGILSTLDSACCLLLGTPHPPQLSPCPLTPVEGSALTKSPRCDLFTMI